MAFFCPIFPKQHRMKAKEYEDSNYYSFDGGGRSLYSSRSMTALNFSPGDDGSISSPKSIDNISSRFMLISSDFDPTVDDELRVRRGDLVKALYRDREWIYVVKENSQGKTEEGFVPIMFCQEIDPMKIRQKTQLSLFKFSRRSGRRTPGNNESKPPSSDKLLGFDDPKSSISSNTPQNDRSLKSSIRPKALMNVDRFLKSLEETKPNSSNEDSSPMANYARIDKEKTNFGVVTDFRKQIQGELVVSYDFEAQNEDDLNVRKGDVVVLLNCDDPNWYWIRRKDGAEGFVPSNYVRKVGEGPVSNRSHPAHPIEPTKPTDQSIPFNELMVIADFEPEAADDLKVIRGDWIYSYQTPALVDNSWLWAYCPRTKRYGFVPNSIVRTPASTVL